MEGPEHARAFEALANDRAASRFHHAAADDARRLREVNARLVPLHRDLFCEANPIPVKWAVARMGHIGFGIRLPLTPLSESQHERVLSAMRAAGIDV